MGSCVNSQVEHFDNFDNLYLQNAAIIEDLYTFNYFVQHFPRVAYYVTSEERAYYCWYKYKIFCPILLQYDDMNIILQASNYIGVQKFYDTYMMSTPTPYHNLFIGKVNINYNRLNKQILSSFTYDNLYKYVLPQTNIIHICSNKNLFPLFFDLTDTHQSHILLLMDPYFNRNEDCLLAILDHPLLFKDLLSCLIYKYKSVDNIINFILSKVNNAPIYSWNKRPVKQEIWYINNKRVNKALSVIKEFADLNNRPI